MLLRNFVFKLVAFSTLFSITAQNAFAEDPSLEDLEMLLSVGKVSGGCGMITNMIDFQNKTQVAGGDNFIDRFLVFESARLGMSGEEYLSTCIKAGKTYDEFKAIVTAAKQAQ